jgi:hypothetical protein
VARASSPWRNTAKMAVPLRLTQDSAQSRNAGLLAKNRKQSTPRNFIRTRYPKNTCENPSNPFFPPSHDLIRLPHDSIPLPHKDLNIASRSFLPHLKLQGVRTIETIQLRQDKVQDMGVLMAHVSTAQPSPSIVVSFFQQSALSEKAVVGRCGEKSVFHGRGSSITERFPGRT